MCFGCWLMFCYVSFYFWLLLGCLVDAGCWVLLMVGVVDFWCFVVCGWGVFVGWLLCLFGVVVVGLVVCFTFSAVCLFCGFVFALVSSWFGFGFWVWLVVVRFVGGLMDFGIVGLGLVILYFYMLMVYY